VDQADHRPFGLVPDRDDLGRRQQLHLAVEARLAGIPGVPAGRVVVVFGRFDGLDTVAAVVERQRGAWVEPAARRLRSETGRSARVLILEVPRHAIPRTSSGKPRRRLLGQELMEGQAPTTILLDWRPAV
jgi:acyl-coenzyme A synthetase/AMP-(fatty) acid ligase